MRMGLAAWDDARAMEATLARAQAGDEQAFRALTEPHRSGTVD